MVEELALAVDDGLRDAQDGVEALLHVLDQPARLLQLAGETGAALTREDVGVQAVDAQARVGVGIDVDSPLPAHLAYHHVGRDIACVERAVLGAGPRVEAADQGLRGAQRVVIAAGVLLELGEIAPGQEFQMLAHDGQGQVAGRVGGQGVELQGEAFLRVARADAGRVEVLQTAQGDLQLLEVDLELVR